jgi:hypothetical protein
MGLAKLGLRNELRLWNWWWVGQQFSDLEIHDFALMVRSEHVSSHCFHYGNIEVFLMKVLWFMLVKKVKIPLWFANPIFKLKNSKVLFQKTIVVSSVLFLTIFHQSSSWNVQLLLISRKRSWNFLIKIYHKHPMTMCKHPHGRTNYRRNNQLKF